MGAFAAASVRIRADTAAARREARRQFVDPIVTHLDSHGPDLVSEIADADAEAPFTPRGCPFQAWSVGELLRLDRAALAERVRKRTAVAAIRRK